MPLCGCNPGELRTTRTALLVQESKDIDMAPIDGKLGRVPIPRAARSMQVTQDVEVTGRRSLRSRLRAPRAPMVVQVAQDVEVATFRSSVRCFLVPRTSTFVQTTYALQVPALRRVHHCPHIHRTALAQKEANGLQAPTFGSCQRQEAIESTSRFAEEGKHVDMSTCERDASNLWKVRRATPLVQEEQTLQMSAGRCLLGHPFVPRTALRMQVAHAQHVAAPGCVHKHPRVPRAALLVKVSQGVELTSFRRSTGGGLAPLPPVLHQLANNPDVSVLRRTVHEVVRTWDRRVAPRRNADAEEGAPTQEAGADEPQRSHIRRGQERCNAARSGAHGSQRDFESTRRHSREVVS